MKLVGGNEEILYIYIYIYIYIYDNQVAGIQHVFFFMFKELIKMKKI